MEISIGLHLQPHTASTFSKIKLPLCMRIVLIFAPDGSFLEQVPRYLGPFTTDKVFMTIIVLESLCKFAEFDFLLT